MSNLSVLIFAWTDSGKTEGQGQRKSPLPTEGVKQGAFSVQQREGQNHIKAISTRAALTSIKSPSTKKAPASQPGFL